MRKFELFQYKNYTKLYFAGLTSEMGSFITDTAIMLFVFAKSGDNKAYLGLTRAIFLFFFTAGTLLGGIVGEKYNKRNILIFCEVCRIPVLLTMIFSDDVHVIMGCNGLIALFTGLFNPSRQAMVNELVPPKHIKAANSLFGSTFATLHVIGPFIGAMAYTTFGGISQVLTFDMMTYVLGIILLFRINFIQKTKTDELKLSVFSELKEIFVYSIKRKDLFTLYFNVFILGIILGTLIPLLLPFTKEILGKGDKEYGYLITLFGVGGVIGGIFSNKLSRAFNSGRLIITSIFIELTIMNIWIRIDDYIFSIILILLWGVTVFIRIPAQLNYLSESVESKYLTRSHSLLNLFFVSPNILGGLLVGIIGESYTTLEILKVTAYAFAAIMLVRLVSGELKTLYFSKPEQVERDETNFI